MLESASATITLAIITWFYARSTKDYVRIDKAGFR